MGAGQAAAAAAAASRSGRWRAVLRSGLGGLLFGGALYLAGDTASDLLVYSKLRRQALELVARDPEVVALVGEPYATGAWYDATLAFTHRDRVAHCTFQLRGSRGVSDVSVKAGRQAGYRSNALYNLAGPGEWALLSCQAMVPSEGGLAAPRSLMPQHREEAAAGGGGGGGGGAAADCDPCRWQQQQQQQQQQGAAPAQHGLHHPWARPQAQPQGQGQTAVVAAAAASGAAAAAAAAATAATEGDGGWWGRRWPRRQPRPPLPLGADAGNSRA